MNVDGAASHSCPAWTELSEAFDSDNGVSLELQKHLDQCPECAGAWRMMAEVQAHLRGRAGEAMRVYNPEAIKQGVYRKLAQPRMISFDKLQRIGSMAAMFFAGMFVFYLYTNISSDKEQPQFVSDGNEQIVASSAGTLAADREFLRSAVAAYPYYTGNESGQIVDSNSRPLALANLVNVDLKGTTSPTFQAVQSDVSTPTHAVSIAENVQHVWVVPDLKQGIQDVRDLLAQLEVTGEITNETATACEMTVRLNKMQLVKLVRAFAAEKGDLVSGAAPQPEQKLFAGVGDTLVTYHIKLLKK